MVDAGKHVAKAKHNEVFLDFIQSNDSNSSTNPLYPDWMVTVAFYIALQYIDSKLATLGLHPGNHRDRDHYVSIKFNRKYLPDLERTLDAVYYYLKSKSENARYMPGSEKTLSLDTVNRCMKLALKYFK